MRIDLYKRGYSLVRGSKTHEKKGGGKRSSLTGKTSAASFRRFRTWCIEHDCGGDCWGITLTVPGLDLMAVEEFKQIHHRLCVFCNDNNFPLVWRVELQQRGQPHIHAVLFGCQHDAMRIVWHWFKLLSSYKVYNVENLAESKEIVFLDRSFVNGSQHAIDVQKLSGDFRAWRYLVAHMTKAKLVQLGWAGRNWGVCNRKFFQESEKTSLFLMKSEGLKISRWIRRLTSGARPFPLISSRRFVKRRFRAFRGTSFMLGDPSVIRRMYDYIVECERIPGGVENAVRDSGARRLYWLFSWFGLQFLASIPLGFFDLVEIFTRLDCNTIKNELDFMALQFWLWYDDVPF